MEWARQRETSVAITPSTNTAFITAAINKTMELRPFPCAYCHKSFKRKDHLQTHEKIHTGVKPFVCGLCGRGYITKANLEYHLYRSQDHDAKAVESLEHNDKTSN